MRKNMTLRAGALATLLMSSLWAQDIAGDWQGTLKAGSQELRLVFQIAKGDKGGWRAGPTALTRAPTRYLSLP